MKGEGNLSLRSVKRLQGRGNYLPGALNGLEKDLKTLEFRGFFIFERRRIYRSVVGVTGLCRDKFTKEK